MQRVSAIACQKAFLEHFGRLGVRFRPVGVACAALRTVHGVRTQGRESTTPFQTIPLCDDVSGPVELLRLGGGTPAARVQPLLKCLDHGCHLGVREVAVPGAVHEGLPQQWLVAMRAHAVAVGAGLRDGGSSVSGLMQ